MNNSKETIAFENISQYKIGAVTYQVTAHFSSQEDTLKSKLTALLVNHIYKKSPDIIANSQKAR